MPPTMRGNPIHPSSGQEDRLPGKGQLALVELFEDAVDGDHQTLASRKAHLTCCRRFRLARSPPPSYHPGVETREERMAADSVYKVIELIGTSSESWEK